MKLVLSQVKSRVSPITGASLACQAIMATTPINLMTIVLALTFITTILNLASTTGQFPERAPLLSCAVSMITPQAIFIGVPCSSAAMPHTSPYPHRPLSLSPRLCRSLRRDPHHQPWLNASPPIRATVIYWRHNAVPPQWAFNALPTRLRTYSVHYYTVHYYTVHYYRYYSTTTPPHSNALSPLPLLPIPPEFLSTTSPALTRASIAGVLKGARVQAMTLGADANGLDGNTMPVVSPSVASAFTTPLLNPLCKTKAGEMPSAGEECEAPPAVVAGIKNLKEAGATKKSKDRQHMKS